jgi:NTE family protein
MPVKSDRSEAQDETQSPADSPHSRESAGLHSHKQNRVGLVLSGGGARGAYQAGVMRGIAEIASQIGAQRPLPIITGVSAGAINAAYLASRIHKFSEAATQMAEMWCNITADQVFRTDALSAGRSGLKFFTDATIGAFYSKKLARSLLDTTPLTSFLDEKINFDGIEKNVQAGHLDALAVTAMDYSNATSITFVQGSEKMPMWQRSRRVSTRAQITRQHVMASAAIPMFFKPVAVGNTYYGDGCLRNTAPLSPAIHLGADRLLVISVRRPDSIAPVVPPTTDLEPSVARILGVILNALLLDAIEIDMERMSRVNTTVSLIPEKQRAQLQLRKVDYLWIRPSRDIGELAGEMFDKLPRVIRYLMGGLGSSKEAAELTSYLLFDPDFCGELVETGYSDALSQRDKIIEFIA